MKKSSRIKKIIISTFLITGILTSSCAFALDSEFVPDWRSLAQGWAVDNGYTSRKPFSELNKEVSLTDLYNTMIKYLKSIGVKPRDESIYHSDDMTELDNVAQGIIKIINSYISKSSITIQQYYIVENYVTHAQKTLNDYIDYSQYLTREQLKNIDLYLSLSRYRAATLIDNRSDREYILSKLGAIKNKEILSYGVIPYAESITRREFLVVMYDLISTNELSENAIISAFYDADVLRGYDTGLELDKKLTYLEMYAFLQRFGGFDFEPDDAEEEAEMEANNS